MKRFLLKINENDRDCVKYIDTKEIGAFECGHYFVGFRIEGACFSGGENELKKYDFDSFTTILTKKELEELFNFNDKIKALGYGIKEGDERYKKGLAYKAEIQKIIDKLNSEENEKLFNKIQNEEKEYLMNEYNLTIEDANYLFDNSSDYKDRAIIDYVFDNIEDLACEEAKNYDLINDKNERYFNYELFGQDLLQEDIYIELCDGRIVRLNY